MADGLVEVLLSHRDRAVVRVGELFVKALVDPTKAERERSALAWAPVPVPEVVWHRTGRPSVMAMARAPGKSLRLDDRTASWRAAGAAARRIHETRPPAGWQAWPAPTTSIEDDRRWLLERGFGRPDAIEAVADLALSALSGRSFEPVAVHGDLQPDHVFVDDASSISCVIDWGDVALGDPMYDLAVLTVHDQHRLDAVLEGYGHGDADRAVIVAWWGQRLLGEIRWMVEHGYDPTERVAALEELASSRP